MSREFPPPVERPAFYCRDIEAHGGDIEAARKVEFPPTRADNSCAYNCYAATLSALCHTFLLLELNISKLLKLTWSQL
jgi:hypothetical protein